MSFDIDLDNPIFYNYWIFRSYTLGKISDIEVCLPYSVNVRDYDDLRCLLKESDFLWCESIEFTYAIYRNYSWNSKSTIPESKRADLGEDTFIVDIQIEDLGGVYIIQGYENYVHFKNNIIHPIILESNLKMLNERLEGFAFGMTGKDEEQLERILRIHKYGKVR